MRQFWTRRFRLRPFVGIAAISVVTLAASSPIYSAVSGRHVIGYTFASQVTVARGTAATADCSRSAARELVERLHLGNADDPQVSEPVGQVLCGPFVGPGSKAMVVSLTIPSCGRTAGWVVFRLVGEEWTLVLTRNNGADLAAIGSDIQETMFVLRPGDAHCFPTGGTRARIWHWDGTRFTASPWKQAMKGEPVAKTFYSPSRNITCWMGDDSKFRGVGCMSRSSPRRVNMDAEGRLKICNGTRCLGCGCAPEDIFALGYGRQITVGRFRCVSQRSGMSCVVVRSGKGFLMSRSGVRQVGP